MKRQYVVPTIGIERYVLTQSITACHMKIGLLDSDCIIKDPDATPEMKDYAGVGWFASEKCSEEVYAGVDYDGICYHTNTQAAFSS
jgi:hypothetical protein